MIDISDEEVDLKVADLGLKLGVVVVGTGIIFSIPVLCWGGLALMVVCTVAAIKVHNTISDKKRVANQDAVLARGARSSALRERAAVATRKLNVAVQRHAAGTVRAVSVLQQRRLETESSSHGAAQAAAL